MASITLMGHGSASNGMSGWAMFRIPVRAVTVFAILANLWDIKRYLGIRSM